MDYLQPPKPRTWLVEAILVTVFCCLPFGIAGIIYAAQVDSYYNAGNYAEAEKASRDAAKWTKIGFLVTIALGVLYLVVIGIIIALGISFN